MSKSNKATLVQACHYLDSKKIPKLLHLLTSHLVVHRPDDPVQFLTDLLRRCKEYRDGEGDPPLLFEPRHVKSIYRTMDPGNKGYISLQQYTKGLQLMGLQGFDPEPPTVGHGGNVLKDTFMSEALRCLQQNLADTLNAHI